MCSILGWLGRNLNLNWHDGCPTSYRTGILMMRANSGIQAVVPGSAIAVRRSLICLLKVVRAFQLDWDTVHSKVEELRFNKNSVANIRQKTGTAAGTVVIHP